MKTSNVAAGPKWLSTRRREQPLPLSGDPVLNYCLEQEARLARQSREVDALRQKIRSEPARHSPAKPADAGSLRSWLRMKLGVG